MAERIMHISLRADYGGAPNYMDVMANNLSDSYELYFACPEDKPYFEKWKSNPRIKQVFVLPHRKFSVKFLLRLSSFIRENKIKLIQSNGKGAGVYGRLLKLTNPRLKIIHAYRGVHIQKYNLLQKYLYLFYERLMLSLTDKVINVSIGEREICIGHRILTRAKSVQIYNGIPAIQPKRTPQLSEKYKGKFVIATLSRFDYAKNMESMIRIAEKCKSEKEILFVLIGDGEDKASLEQKSRELGLNNIDFVGFKNKEQISEYLSNTDLYLSTSRWEGLPFALIEASSMKIPIVASDVVGNNEVCKNEINGFLFPSENEEIAKEKILKIKNDSELKALLGENSRKVFENSFTVEKMVKNHQELYHSLLV
ncbi:glycosyltransferase [Lentiprolixibacter aurantiacus]|uniref:Glycosyltransferase n=1 Tax=Lentiprolixibacter aurantiacus TaxID=2993939 RepID=A0AAE3SNJ8_9FLAO|nr:glycosyltransferase [Lentiprolixibacter aurantiacus]MCX2718547.1 glycosyltransferase [Lentiprolixibacter aurantiacus]